MRRGWIGAPALLALALARAPAQCDCPASSPKDHLQAATYVFTGTVSELDADRQTGVKSVVFDVDDSFKGSPPAEVRLTDRMAESGCALPFKTDESYLVYAHWVWGAVVTSRCDGTELLKDGQQASALGPTDAAKEKYYDRLRGACTLHEDVGCCKASVTAMGQGGYLPEPSEGCPEGMVPDRLKCFGSYLWCIPIGQPDHRSR